MVAKRTYNIVAQHGGLKSMGYPWPSEFELNFVCDKCNRSMKLPIRWDDKEYKLRKSEKCSCGKLIKIKEVPEVVSKEDFVKDYVKHSEEDEENKVVTDVCTTIKVVGDFSLKYDLFMGSEIVWKALLGDNTVEFTTNFKGDWVEKKKKKEEEEEEEEEEVEEEEEEEDLACVSGLQLYIMEVFA